jgi:hypothetical protein
MINTNSENEYIDTNTKLVFLGDAVDRGDRGKNELDLLKILVHLSDNNKMLLLAGNRDINKMRMRYEFAITLTLTIDGVEKEMDAYEVLYYYVTFLPTEVKNLVEKISDAFPKDITYFLETQNDRGKENILYQIWIALAYQFLTRRDDHNSELMNKKDSDINITNAKWTFDGKLVLDKYWRVKKGGSKKKGGNNKEVVIDEPFEFINNKWEKKTETHNASITEAQLHTWIRAMEDIEEKYRDSTYPPPNKDFLKNVYKFLEYKSANRVSNLLKTYGIQNVDKNYVNWVEWAKAALSDFNNLGLYVKYLENCKFFHKIQLGDVKIICSHSIASKEGILSNLGNTDTIKAGDWPIQTTRTNIYNGTDINEYSCKSTGCNCPENNNKDVFLLSTYMTNIDKAPSNENDSILRIVTQAVGIPPETVLTNPNGVSETTPEPERYDMICFLKDDEGKINTDKTFIVHGHQPFGIPYSQDVKIIDGDRNNTHIIKRICVDVSRDGDYSGDQYDPRNNQVFDTRKNWAYVTFSYNGSTKSLDITAIGEQQGTKYTIPDMRKLKFKSKIDVDVNNNESYNYGDPKNYAPYMGLEKDSINKNPLSADTTTDIIIQITDDEVTKYNDRKQAAQASKAQSGGKSKKPRSKKSK